MYSKLCHVTFLNLLVFRMKRCQFHRGLVSGGKCYSLCTFRRMKLVIRKKIEGKKECQNGIACRYFSGKPFLYSVGK